MTLGRADYGILAEALLLPALRAEHIMSMAPHVKRWTAADARALTHESRHWPLYEVIDGNLLVTPAPRLMHQRAIDALRDVIRPYLKRYPVGELLSSPADLELEVDTTVQPDLFVVPISGTRKAREWSDVRELMLAIEVVSPSTSHGDRTTKRDFYLRVGVPEYWIVDLAARSVERWRGGADRADRLSESLSWRPIGAAEPLIIALPAVFTEAHGE